MGVLHVGRGFGRYGRLLSPLLAFPGSPELHCELSRARERWGSSVAILTRRQKGSTFAPGRLVTQQQALP